MIAFPIAKVNLGLNVVEKRPDGYHNLETVFYPVPIKDVLEIQLMDAAILDEPERELPPYRSKLHAYDKRRNYSKKSYWNRIRSRLF